MPTLASLKETRAAKADALKALAARAETERRDLTDTESDEIAAGIKAIDKLDRDIRNAEFLAEAERRAEAEPVTGSGEALADIERRVSVGQAVSDMLQRGQLTGAAAEWAAEHRSGRPGAFALPVSCFLAEHRAVTTTTPGGGPGGNLVPTNLGPTIDRLRPTLAVAGLGATVLSGLTGNLDLPRLKASGAAGWVGEHVDATPSDPLFDKVSMGPKTVTGQYEMSRRMMIQAPQLEQLLRADIGFLLRQALDLAAILGEGDDDPLGLMNTAGTALVHAGTDGGPLTLDLTADMIGAIDAADATGARGFLTNAAVKTVAMKMKDANRMPYGIATVFHGEPVAFSNQVPSDGTKGEGEDLSAILYGAWADLIIGYWSAVDIVLNPYHADVASKGGALLHAFLDADIAVRHAESFALCKDVSRQVLVVEEDEEESEP